MRRPVSPTTITSPRGRTASPTAGPLRVGGLELDSRVLVAPMVGITDAPFRRLARELGAGLVFVEMVAAEAVVRHIPRTMELLSFEPGVSPVAAQLVGSDPAVMAEAAAICAERGAVMVDVNLGCPVPTVTNRGSGAALARDPSATQRVVAAMARAVPVPVTAKLRLGWDQASINAVELSRALEDAGCAMVTVHGRTRAQRYLGRADWSEIARVREAVGIPVVGSGDVADVQEIRRRLQQGVVDAVMIARGALGNLWLIRQASHHVATGELLPDLGFAERIELTRRHLELLIDHYGERRALIVGRKYVAWTIRGCAGAARLRAMVQTLTTRTDLETILELALHAGLGPQGWFQPVFTSGHG
ncbi:MAG TPA: tRNA dihydrouridine synthase DusB [Candidatus Binatia bacterium]|nr:tRNA dihydrouridine synthase DusB [Candidatus Binatia bacterium]